MRVVVTSEPVDAAAQLGAFQSRNAASGAIASFIGAVRGEDGVTALEIDHYPGFCERMIGGAVAAAEARWPLADIAIIHRIGAISPGETIVGVFVAAAHRREAFEACDFLMDYLKTDAPFWKREHRVDGDRWIEPRGQDYRDRERWRTKET